MNKMMQSVSRFLRDEDGLVAIEYGILATFIALAMAVGANLLGIGLNTMFTNISDCFDKPAGANCPVTMPVPGTP